MNCFMSNQTLTKCMVDVLLLDHDFSSANFNKFFNIKLFTGEQLSLLIKLAW